MADIAKITLKGESEAKNFIDEALRGDIAYEELSTTVSKAGGYVAGDHLIYLGQYYEVVADIAQGGTIVTSGAGQNVEEREVGDEIKKNKTQYEVMPVASADYLNRVITYIGATTATYTSGQSYQCVYDSVNDTYSWEATSSKVEIDNKTIVENADGELETAVKTFTGKRVAWNALSAEEKAYYDGGIVNFTDDSEDAGSVLGVICDVETSPATAAHSAGDQFYYDGALVEATSAIAIGDTIVVSPDTEYNVKVADKVVAQMQTLANNVSDINTALGNEVATRSKLGAKNILLSNAVSITTNGITYTVNANGSVTANGTATASAVLLLNENVELPKGQYVFSDNANSTDSNVQFILEVAGGSPRIAACYGSQREQPFSTEQDYTLRCYIWIGNGTTVNNVTFYPMIRLATDASSDYEPYSMTNQELTPIAQAVSNRNLLDNPWFTVNQRGQNSYTTTWAYTVDRWRMANLTSVTVNDGSITLSRGEQTSNQQIFQLIDNSVAEVLDGKQVTISIMLSDGSVNSKTGILDFGTTGNKLELVDTNYALYIYKSSTTTEFRIWVRTDNTQVAVKAVKLELGSVSTLAMDTAPNYATELLKCQRYFCRIGGTSNGYPICVGRAHNATQGRYLIKLPVEMRSNAVVTVSDLTKVRELCNHQQSTPTAFMAGGMEKGGYMSFYTTTSGLVTDELVGLLLNAEYIDISADL